MEFNNQYLKYEEYKELGGNLDETPFNLLEFKARKLIDNLTKGRLTNLELQKQETKLCCFELINKLIEYSKISNKTSESIGSWSASFATSKDQKQEINNIINDYLNGCVTDDGIPYLYLGDDYCVY